MFNSKRLAQNSALGAAVIRKNSAVCNESSKSKPKKILMQINKKKPNDTIFSKTRNFQGSKPFERSHPMVLTAISYSTDCYAVLV